MQPRASRASPDANSFAATARLRAKRPVRLYSDQMLSPLLFELPAFLLGLLFGSFLNVCISRLPEHASLSRPRSHCPNCRATIVWHDNIPLLSWILLRARCRYCKQPISWRYPAVELAFGLWLAVAAHAARIVFATAVPANLLVQHTLDALGFAILGFMLLGLLVMDWQTHTLPDAFTLTGIFLGFVLICIRAAFLAPHQYELLLHGQNPLSSPGSVLDNGNVVLTGPEHLVLGRLLAIILAGCLILLIRAAYQFVRRREGMGLGDAKLLAMLAAFLGFWPAMLALFLGVILCSAYALILLARRRVTALTRIPLGTFLSIGGLITLLIGEALLTWYKSLL
jgi:leader peptidase (prepilin peptidase)/N-methyltransferase